MIQPFEPHQLEKLYMPPSDSHKGQNGKLLVIGGSKLFHASIFWSADIASKIVDLVHFSSPANENNDLVRSKIKNKFWNGIVVDWREIENYIQEDDAILIGPGMPREEGLFSQESSTKDIVDSLILKHPQKKWIVDGGALQEINPKLLNQKMIITPHQKELVRLVSKLEKNLNLFTQKSDLTSLSLDSQAQILSQISNQLNKVTIVCKGEIDLVCQGDQVYSITGGNAGMTKGGTGDILAGLGAALYTKNSALLSALAASFINKKAAEQLFQSVGPFFGAGDLIQMIPKVLNSFTSKNT